MESAASWLDVVTVAEYTPHPSPSLYGVPWRKFTDLALSVVGNAQFIVLCNCLMSKLSILSLREEMTLVEPLWIVLYVLSWLPENLM